MQHDNLAQTSNFHCNYRSGLSWVRSPDGLPWQHSAARTSNSANQFSFTAYVYNHALKLYSGNLCEYSLLCSHNHLWTESCVLITDEPKARARVDAALHWHHSNVRKGAAPLVMFRVIAKNIGVPPNDRLADESEALLMASLKVRCAKWSHPTTQDVRQTPADIRRRQEVKWWICCWYCLEEISFGRISQTWLWRLFKILGKQCGSPFEAVWFKSLVVSKVYTYKSCCSAGIGKILVEGQEICSRRRDQHCRPANDNRNRSAGNAH